MAALTQDDPRTMDYPGVGKTTVDKAVAAVAATESAIDIKKGSLIFLHADGYADNVVASGAMDDVFFGVARVAVEIPAVAAAGATIEEEYEVIRPNRVWLPHTGAARTDVGALFHATDDNTLGDGAANSNGECTVGRAIDFAAGELLIDTTDRS